MVLLQEKLDVTVKNRSNLFNWRGQFTPEFVEYILSTFTQANDTVLDPFSGSGTVLQEAAMFDLNAVGLEINPAAHFMSSFFNFCKFTEAERICFCDNFEAKLSLYLLNMTNEPVYVNTPNYRDSFINLLDFARRFNREIEDENERAFFINLLFQSEKDKKLTLKDSILKSFKYLKNSLIDLPYSTKRIESHLMDARNAGNYFQNEIDFIITSPPYINVFNYHQNYRAIIEEFHYDILGVAHSEFGSNRKNRGNRFKTVVQYCIDMDLSIRGFWKALKENKKIVMVLGRESNVRGTPFYNGQLIIEILEACGGFENIHTGERQFTNKFGANIKEDIIIATKSDKPLIDALKGKTIAFKHLEESLNRSKEGVNADIEAAIKEINEIQPSPLLNPNNIFSHD